MTVDSTHLLNLRHLEDKDSKWMTPFPQESEDIMSFDEVRIYSELNTPSGDFGVCNSIDAGRIHNKKIGIVTYGDGVLESLKAKAQICKEGCLGSHDVDVIDSP
jgi:hypothetical protein